MTEDHVYATRDGGRTLELTVHADPSVTATAVVVFFHGGGWAAGTRHDSLHHVAGLLRRGVIVVAPDYRLTGTDPHPAQVQDAGDAYEWAVTHLAAPRKLPVFVSGVSAGGHLAAILGLGAWERLTTRTHTAPIAGSIPFSLVLDANLWASERRFAPRPAPGTFAHRSYTRSGIWPPRTQDLADALLRDGDGPIAHALTAHIDEGTRTPFLIVHGAADTCVRADESVQLFTALREVNPDVELLVAAGLDHDDQRFAEERFQSALWGFIRQYTDRAAGAGDEQETRRA